jgi:hypothetical protein
LRKISAKGPYMVLEAFLLIHMSGSSTFYDTESNNFCLLEQIIHNNQTESFIQSFDATEENTNEGIFAIESIYFEPDTLIKSDSVNLQENSSIKSDSIHTLVAFPISLATIKPENKIASEIPNPEKVFELPKPEFALTSEQNYTGNYNNYFSKSLEIRKLRSKHSIFKQNESIDFKDKIIPLFKTNPQQDWFSIILLSSILLIAWIRSFFGRYFQQSLQSFYDFTLSTRLFRNKNVLLPRISFLLLVNFIIISSLFTFKTLEIINISIFKTSFSNFILLNLFFLMLITLRFISFHGLNMLFPRNQLIMEYHYQVQNFYKSIGLLILPILLFATYLPTGDNKVFVWCGLCVITILYVYRLLRGQRIIHRKNFTLPYLFLYIITFEILPISICFKIFSEII